MKFKADEIAAVIQKEIEQYDSQLDVREVGTVLEVGDGIARVHGLSGVMAGEMVEFSSGVTGLAFNLEEDSVGVIILGDFLAIQEGEEVKTLGRLLSVPVGMGVGGSDVGVGIDVVAGVGVGSGAQPAHASRPRSTTMALDGFQCCFLISVRGASVTHKGAEVK